ncbi:transcription elongation factor GreB [Aureimonas endophytica]|uniref:Transcription elongation factor GreB n=1 Tax=Aureimonas endophytica TaxID=2027858 RepID=A0A917EB49_9HYPH|nr:transcription elongation factor GreA [Aureimonas endophytica]GGE20452.1 transcription elongation factor GreB [Aureimonas endophytica]
MSVAFVKEPNEDQVEVLPDRDLGTEPNLVTARGLELIDAALAEGEAGLAAAREAGDKIAMATLNRDLRYWRARRATAQLVEPQAGSDVVQFGSAVTIERDDGRRQRFRIVGIDEADPAKGLVSYLSPLARGLVGKAVGDVARAGPGEAEIVAIAHD